MERSRLLVTDAAKPPLRQATGSLIMTLGRKPKTLLIVMPTKHKCFSRRSVSQKSPSIFERMKLSEKGEPNNAMEPTPVNVTIPAAQEVAPSTFMAHL
jgi:hypothetical protein